MRTKIWRVLFLLLAIGLVFFYWLTLPQKISAEDVPADYQADLKNGERLFWAGGCASCHAVPGAKGDAKLILAGGAPLITPFGTFVVPNISPDTEVGIGGWSNVDFINAMVRGVSPKGEHYYPAFPYTNYQRMPYEDLIDLKAYLDSLPKSSHQPVGHKLGFPFNIRQGLGLWKKLYLDGKTLSRAETRADKLSVGRYLVEGPGHCAACHSPRNLIGGEIADARYSGATELEQQPGKKTGKVPNITPHADGIGSWSEKDIAYALETGLDPDFDSFGGSMVSVQENMAKLTAADREAIAAYLKSLPAVPSSK